MALQIVRPFFIKKPAPNSGQAFSLFIKLNYRAKSPKIK